MAEIPHVPIARSDSVMVIRHDQLILWGGYTQTVYGEGDDRFIVALNLPDTDSEERDVEIYNLDTMRWEKTEPTSGDSYPVFGKGACSALIGDHLYVFGGLDDEDYRKDLHRLDLVDFTWKGLSKRDCPSERSYGGMVAHGECLFVFGGIGKPPLEPSRMGAETIRDDRFGGNFVSEWNNSMHEYNTVTDKWRELECTGSRPPPLERFSFDKIDQDRALLFGGKRGLFSAGLNSFYILDLDIMDWEGPIDPSPDQAWPDGRGVHATTCLVDPESELAAEHQQIVAFWGEGKNAIHLPDIWLLHVSSRTWKQINLDFVPRKYHMCASHFVRERQVDVVVYGGNKRRKTKFERNVMTDMIIFRFGAVRELENICVNFIKKNMNTFMPFVPSLPKTLKQKIESQEQYSLYYPNEHLSETRHHDATSIGAVRELADICVNFIKKNMNTFMPFVPSLPKTLKQKIESQEQ